MANLIKTNFQPGSLIEQVSGELFTNTGAVFVKGDRSRALYMNGATMVSRASIGLTGNTMSINGSFSYSGSGVYVLYETSLDYNSYAGSFSLLIDAKKLYLGYKTSDGLIIYYLDEVLEENTEHFISVSIDTFSAGGGVYTLHYDGESKVLATHTDTGNRTTELTDNGLYVGQRGSASFGLLGVIGDFDISNELQTNTESLEKYAEYLERQHLDIATTNFQYSDVLSKNMLDYYGADGIYKPRSQIPGIVNGNLNIAVNELLTNDVCGLSKGQKYLRSDSSGFIAFENNNAYGEYEFFVKKVNLSASLSVGFISDKDLPRYNFLGYMMGVAINLNLNLVHNKPTYFNLLNTATNFVEKEKWYSIKVVRSGLGEFSAYIKGGLFGCDYNLITASTGSNPVTNNNEKISNYAVFMFGAGDEFIPGIRKE